MHQNQLHDPPPSLSLASVQLIVADRLLPVIYEYVSDFLQSRGGPIETGGMLTGEFDETTEGAVFRIGGFIGAGPAAECLSESVLFDADYQSRMLELTQQAHPEVGNMGCIHLHPDGMDVCSEKDWLADIEAVRASDTKMLVFAIITINNPRVNPLSVYYRNFKFDFYILSPKTNFEYQHIRPILKPMQVIQAEPALAGVRESSNTAVNVGRHYAASPKLLQDKKRLVAEVRAMEERYGGWAILRLDNNRLFWEYTVRESGREFPIQIYYPRRYPLEPPRIFSVLPLPSSPHQMPDNEICWTNRLAASEWNPARDTAVTCIHAAHRWFACLLVYLTLGKWPTEADDEFRCSV